MYTGMTNRRCRWPHPDKRYTSLHTTQKEENPHHNQCSCSLFRRTEANMYALDKPDYEADHPGVSVLFLTTHELGGVCLQVHAAWNVFLSFFPVLPSSGLTILLYLQTR
jgi:hypothetical protein